MGESIKPLLKQEIFAIQKSRMPIKPLPPIDPALRPLLTNPEVEAQGRQDRWLDNATRIGGDFVATGTVKTDSFPGSVHNGQYIAPHRNLERDTKKSSWVA